MMEMESKTSQNLFPSAPNYHRQSGGVENGDGELNVKNRKSKNTEVF